MKHTPGPWRHVAIQGGWDGIETAERHATTLIAKLVDNNPANASRIVACVNACEGINPEAVPLFLECCQAALSYMLDDSRSQRRRTANVASLQQAIAKADDFSEKMG